MTPTQQPLMEKSLGLKWGREPTGAPPGNFQKFPLNHRTARKMWSNWGPPGAQKLIQTPVKS